VLMSILNRRLQILVDESRYARLESAAEERGTAVAVLVREAIDRYLVLPDGGDRRAAGERLLSAPEMAVDDWPRLKQDLLSLGEPR
jgi:hypothetical protein